MTTDQICTDLLNSADELTRIAGKGIYNEPEVRSLLCTAHVYRNVARDIRLKEAK